MIDFRDNIRQCNNCTLRCNQPPLIDQNTVASVFWVGLSAVKVEDVNLSTPLSSSTNTGKLISEIELLCTSNNFYKTNIVKCLPLNDTKIRYPTKGEMKSCYHNLELEINILQPALIFLLGKQVSDFVANKFDVKFDKLDEDFNYLPFKIGNLTFIQVHHPSYILVYKRKKVDLYRQKIAQLIKKDGQEHKNTEGVCKQSVPN